MANAVVRGRTRQQSRLDDHAEFVKQREASGKEIKHFNENHQMKVMSAQEKELKIELPEPMRNQRGLKVESMGFQPPQRPLFHLLHDPRY